VDSERYSTVQRPPRGEKQGSRDSGCEESSGGRDWVGRYEAEQPMINAQVLDGGIVIVVVAARVKSHAKEAKQSRREKKIVAGMEKPISNFSGRWREGERQGRYIP